MLTVGSVVIWTWLSSDFPIIGLKLCSSLCKMNVWRVKCIAVCDDLRNICMELSRTHILVRPEVVLHCRQIHRFLDYFSVVRNPQSNWIYRLSKRPRCFIVFEEIENTDAWLEIFADVVKIVPLEVFLRTVLLVDCVLKVIRITIVVVFLGSSWWSFASISPGFFLNKEKSTFVFLLLT